MAKRAVAADDDQVMHGPFGEQRRLGRFLAADHGEGEALRGRLAGGEHSGGLGLHRRGQFLVAARGEGRSTHRHRLICAERVGPVQHDDRGQRRAGTARQGEGDIARGGGTGCVIEGQEDGTDHGRKVPPPCAACKPAACAGSFV